MTDAKRDYEPVPVLEGSQSREGIIPNVVSAVKDFAQTALRAERRAASSVSQEGGCGSSVLPSTNSKHRLPRPPSPAQHHTSQGAGLNELMLIKHLVNTQHLLAPLPKLRCLACSFIHCFRTHLCPISKFFSPLII